MGKPTISTHTDCHSIGPRLVSVCGYPEPPRTGYGKEYAAYSLLEINLVWIVTRSAIAAVAA